MNLSNKKPFLTTLSTANTALSLTFIFLLSVFPSQSSDIFMYLSLGKKFLHDGSFPLTDPNLFSLTDYHWNILHEWGSFVLASSLFSLGGWTGIILAKATLILLVAFLLYFMALKLRHDSWVLPLWIALIFFAGSLRFTERASLISDCFTSLILIWILLQRSSHYLRTNLQWTGPVIFLFWTNLHPGFYLGLLLLALTLTIDFYPYVRGRLSRYKSNYLRFSLVSATSLVACFCNPKGLSGFLFPLRPLLDPAWATFRNYNFEWMPTWSNRYTQHLSIQTFFLILSLVFALNLVIIGRTARKKKYADLPFFESAVLLIFIVLGLSAVRFVSSSVLIAGVLGISFLSQLNSEACSIKTQSILKFAVFSFLIVANFHLLKFGYPSPLGPRKWGVGIDVSKRPIKASEFIERTGLQGNIFNERGFGCYLAWRWQGKRKIFIDGFVDDMNFSEKDYYSIQYSAEGFDRVVDQYKLDIFLLATPPSPDSSTPLFLKLAKNQNWKLIYRDPVAVIFAKNNPKG